MCLQSQLEHAYIMTQSFSFCCALWWYIKLQFLAVQHFYLPPMEKETSRSLSLGCTCPPVFSLPSLSSAVLSLRGQVIKAPQSKQGMENGLLSFLLLRTNAALIPAVMKQRWSPPCEGRGSRHTPSHTDSSCTQERQTLKHANLHAHGSPQCLISAIREHAQKD